MPEGKKQIREEIIRKLIENRVFWSYRKPEKHTVSDELVIEKTLKHLDIEYIQKLFLLYPAEKIKLIWVERMIPDERYQSVNILLAYLLFGIKDPEQYLERKKQMHYKRLASL